MKNLKVLSTEETKSINGGCQVGDCWPFPKPFPRPYPRPFPGPTYPEPKYPRPIYVIY